MKQNEQSDSENIAEEDERVLDLLAENVDAMLAIDTTDVHQERPAQKVLESVGRSFETPAFFIAIALFVAAWIGINLFGDRMEIVAFDRPPFPWLQGIISLASLVTMVVVLIRQGAEARREHRRGHVELQLIILTEQKVAKLIALLEELRRDLPVVDKRHDPQAEVLGKTMHPQKVLDTIQKKMGDAGA